MGEAFLVPSPTHTALRALNYAPDVERLRRVRGVRPLGSITSQIGGSFGSVFTRVDCERSSGVPLFSQVDTFAVEPEGRRVRLDCLPRPDQQVIKKWQILVAAAGQMSEGNLFGRSIIADGRLAGSYCGPDTLALTFEEAGGDTNLWAYAFLNTRIGIRALRACVYGTSIPRLRPDLVKQIPIPHPDDASAHRVAELLRRTVADRERFHVELTAARRVLESRDEMREASLLCSERKARCVMWSGPLRTLTAWNTASTGGALGMLQGTYRARLGDVIAPAGIYYGPRFARIAAKAPHGVDFMSQRDVFLIRPSPRRIAHPGFADRKLFVEPDTMLVGAQGTLGEGEIFGQVAFVRGELVGMAYTQHLLRIVPKGKGALLYTYLSTAVGTRLLRSTGVGTKLLSMREDLLRDLPVPELAKEEREKVEAHIDTAFDAREAASLAEREAIGLVEHEVARRWLG